MLVGGHAKLGSGFHPSLVALAPVDDADGVVGLRIAGISIGSDLVVLSSLVPLLHVQVEVSDAASGIASLVRVGTQIEHPLVLSDRPPGQRLVIVRVYSGDVLAYIGSRQIHPRAGV